MAVTSLQRDVILQQNATADIIVSLHNCLQLVICPVEPQLLPVCMLSGGSLGLDGLGMRSVDCLSFQRGSLASSMERRSLDERSLGEISLGQSLSRTTSMNGWEIDNQDIVILTREDGSDWLLGQGSYGQASSVTST